MPNALVNSKCLMGFSLDKTMIEITLIDTFLCIHPYFLILLDNLVTKTSFQRFSQWKASNITLLWLEKFTIFCNQIVFRIISIPWLVCLIVLMHLRLMLPIYAPWKHLKTYGFLIFSGGIEREQWPKLG